MQAAELIDVIIGDANISESRFRGPYRIFIGRPDNPAQGRWVDLPDERELRRAMGEAGGEWIVSDFDLPFRVDEYENPILINEFVEAIEDRNIPAPVVEWFIEWAGGVKKALDQVDRLEEIFFIEADSEEDLAYEYIDQRGGVERLDKDILSTYFDYVAYGRDLAANEYTERDGYFIDVRSI